MNLGNARRLLIPIRNVFCKVWEKSVHNTRWLSCKHMMCANPHNVKLGAHFGPRSGCPIISLFLGNSLHKSHKSRQSRASEWWRKVEHLTVSVGTWRQMLRKMRRTPSILPLVTLGHGRLLMSEYIRGCSTITVLRSSVSQLHLLATATVTYLHKHIHL